MAACNHVRSFEFGDEAPGIDIEALSARYADSVSEYSGTPHESSTFSTDFCRAIIGKIGSFDLFEWMGVSSRVKGASQF